MDQAANKERSVSRFIWTVVIIIVVITLASVAYWTLDMIQREQTNKINSLTTTTQNLSKQLADQSKTVYTSSKGVHLYVYSPTTNTKVVSQLAVVGMVPGNWSFENNFPVVLENDQGTAIAQTPATLIGTWMTDTLQPFTASLTIPAGQSGSGTLVLQNDNPSGLPANADSVSIPIQF